MSDMNAEQIAALVAAAVAKAMGDQAPTKAKTADKSTVTAAKAKAITRNLDPVDITTSNEEVTFRVVAHGASGTLYHNGARVLPLIGGKVQRSFTADAITALAESADEIAAGIATVDKRAKLGAFKPAKVA